MGKKKTGIMGGTFNPIHMGHLLLAENAKEAFGLDEILFVPSGLPYMKNGIEIADKWMRLEMTRLAVSDNPAFAISSAEVEREGNSYTWETLELLRDKEPETEFFLSKERTVFLLWNRGKIRKSYSAIVRFSPPSGMERAMMTCESRSTASKKSMGPGSG